MNTTTAPQLREGSTGGKAVRYLQLNGGEATQAALFAGIELDEDDAGMLGYAQRLGVLAREERGGVIYWRLGDGKPVEPPAPPSAAEIPVFVPPPVSGYGDKVRRLLAYLEQHAPAGSGKWLLSRTLGQVVDVEAKQVYAILATALASGDVVQEKQEGYLVWQRGPGTKAEAPPPKAVDPPAAPPLKVSPFPVPPPLVKPKPADSFRCGIFIEKGGHRMDLVGDEMLEVFEQLHVAALFSRRAAR